MTEQLRLIETSEDWRLDEQTRLIGRHGVAAAREALRRSRPRYARPERDAA